MQVTARSYLAAGVALVGASAIAVSPLAPPAPDVHLPAINVSSAAVELSAMADPLVLWGEVIGTAIANVGGLGEQWLADPAPVLMQAIANQLHTANVLGTAGQTLVDGLTAALAPEGWTSFPAALQAAFDLIEAGEFETGFSSVISSFLLLGLPLITATTIAWPALAQPFTNLAQLVTRLPEALPALVANGVLSPLSAVAAASGRTLESIVSAATNADAAEFLTTLANTPAVLTHALLNGDEVDGWFNAGLLTPQEGFIPGGAIATVLGAIAGIANSIATPGADRHDLFGNLPGFGTADPATAQLNSTGTTTVTLDVAPRAELAKAPAVAPAESVSAPTDTATDIEPAAGEAAPKAELVKVSTKADLEQVGTGSTKSEQTKPVKRIRQEVKDAVKNLTDGLKKATSGLGGRSPKGKDGAGTSSSTSGGNGSASSSSAGANSGGSESGGGNSGGSGGSGSGSDN